MKQTNFISKYFPSKKEKWKLYFKTTVPIVLASFIFALNAFVDNFMSINLEGGNQALSYANTWTEIQIGIISITAILGIVIFAQYLGKQDYEKVKEIISMRILLALVVCLLFAIPCMITPKNMVLLASGFDYNMPEIVLDQSIIYLRLITIAWIINSIWFSLSMVMREKHHTIASFIATLISLVVNIILNAVFLFALNLGIDFLAYSTIISSAVSLCFIIIFIILKDKQLCINPLKIFMISSVIFKQFMKRWLSFALFAIASLAVNVRFIFWNMGYPTGSIGDPAYMLSAANILGISGMLFNIFWTTLESVNANVSIYVGRELGKNNFEQAQINANELQGFHFLVAMFMGLCLFALSFTVVHMNYLASGYEQALRISYEYNSEIDIDYITKQGTKIFLENLKYTIWPLALLMAMFIWFITRNRVMSAGGYTNISAIIEALSGWAQIAWLVLICLVFNKNNTLSFPLAYFIFFLTDVVKFIIYEVIFRKVNWLRNITEIEEKNNKSILL